MLLRERRPSLRAASLAGAVVAAIAASACCVVPALLAIFGVSGAGIALELGPYRPILLGLGAASLAVGFYLTYRKPKNAGTAASERAGQGLGSHRFSGGKGR